ncbi:hypothetical protein [Corynebacterium sp. KPL2680]|uniref:hypothetical protein n=1 Tax=Corynebacterium sp. KPL2680 TaxID=3158310 RepID=UPI0032EDC7B6
MRTVYLVLAALACIAAVAARAVTGTPWLPLVALIIAAVFLALALRANFQRAEEATLEDLDKEQRAEIKRLLGNGQFGTAVNQVRLWFRGTTHERATEIVQQLT